ncbi:MAG TPA: hypothetical protein VK489_10765 [Ferruginibacter sp.]|nr:hypothetical protein [Ferruginibacter sp.]
MIKNLLSLILLLACNFSYAQVTTTIKWETSSKTNSRDTIYYDPNKKLNWHDFRGRPEKNSRAAAITESGFGYRLAMQYNSNGKANIVISVVCFFNKTGSWVKNGMASDYALTHEQHHFDLTYIAARAFVEKLKATRFTIENCASLVERINDEFYRELDSMQNDYDGETKNGQLRNIQVAWNKKIDLQLEDLFTN